MFGKKKKSDAEERLASQPPAPSVPPVTPEQVWRRSSPGLKQAVREAEVLLNYAASHGIAPREEVLNMLLRAKRLERTNDWTIKDESHFWLAYDELVEAIRPVTPESLQASLPPLEIEEEREERLALKKKWASGWRKGVRNLFGIGKYNPPVSQAREAVQRYKRFAIFTLVALLLVQIYWFAGSDTLEKVNVLFVERMEVDAQIESLKKQLAEADLNSSPELTELQERRKLIAQKMDASYELLRVWNDSWLAVAGTGGFEGKVTEFENFSFNMEKQQLEEKLEKLREKQEGNSDANNDAVLSQFLGGGAPALPGQTFAPQPPAQLTAQGQMGDGMTPGGAAPTSPSQAEAKALEKDIEALEKEIEKYEDAIRQTQHQHEYDKARNRLFLNLVGANFILNSLQTYFLPLLYGLLGACTYVLRQLSVEVHQLTYSRVSEIRYGLRLALGALGGMAISWFVKPDDATGLASLSPMALAFLTGYNVELLFAIMDKIINTALKSLQSEEEKAISEGRAISIRGDSTPPGTLKGRAPGGYAFSQKVDEAPTPLAQEKPPHTQAPTAPEPPPTPSADAGSTAPPSPPPENKT
jgi:nucleoid-associated protein YgaU